MQNKYVFLLMFLLSITCVSVGCSNEQGEKRYIYNVESTVGFRERMGFDESTQIIGSGGSIQNSGDAEKIARVIFETAYRKNYDYGLPLKVQFYESDQVWLITNRVPRGKNGTWIFLAIKQFNAEVIATGSKKGTIITDGEDELYDSFGVHENLDEFIEKNRFINVEEATKKIISKGCVRSASDAEKIARILYDTIYSAGTSKASRENPFIVTLYKKDQIWHVQDQPPPLVPGGRVWIAIEKSNSKIILMQGGV